MKKRFKYKYQYKYNYKTFKIVVSLILVLLLLIFIIKSIFFFNHKLNNKYFVDNLLSFSNSYIKRSKRTKINLNLLSFNNPNSLIGINYKGLIKAESFELKVNKEEVIIDENKPLVFIYSTHSSETYKNNNNNPYNIKPTVRIPSYILKEQLNKLKIKAIVDETDVVGVLNSNGWSYDLSYQVSKMIIEDAKKKYPSVKYFIDIHRDSALLNTTKIVINNKEYARLLFIVGMENKTYVDNLNMTQDLNNLLNKDYFNITRGIYKKSGPGVNGVYNQDLSPKAILLEVGGVDNTIDQVYNSMEVFAKIYGKYIIDRKDNI
ncbi:MAG: stage II sporulation protein P [Bacilli bacterium]